MAKVMASQGALIVVHSIVHDLLTTSVQALISLSSHADRSNSTRPGATRRGQEIDCRK